MPEEDLAPLSHEYPLLEEELAYENCTQPPDGVRVRWCEVNRAACADTAACPGYRVQCGAILDLPAPTSGFAGAAGHAAPLMPFRRTDRDPSGCSAAGTPAHGGAWAWPVALALAMWPRRRRDSMSRRWTR